MADNNPYVGPAPFSDSKEDRRRFFGRDEEARELSYLLIARPAVLLYAQSGAGKTSLLQAKVIPDLRDSGEIRVLPITRVSGPAEDGNVYVANALAGLKSTAANLTEAMAPFFGETQDGEMQVPHLLIVDQFEEIFTFHPELEGPRREFFGQLRDCLNAYPKLGLLLSMREDYLADMDSFAGYLPDRLRTRTRMERLSDKQAEEAIARPAADAGKPFDAGVARRLADDLRRVQTSRKAAAGATDNGHALGKYVEPVQLQIVCQQLWSKLPQAAPTITAEHTKTLASVDDALTNFYRDSLAAVRGKVPALSERTLREWFGGHLITSAKTRGLVYVGESETEGLPNEVVEALGEKGKPETKGLANAVVEILVKKYILRAEVLRPSWYELAHDRLVEPILADNLEWRAKYKNPAADAYQRWLAAGRSSEKLLSGNLLAEATEFAKKNPGDVTAEEQAFLDSSVAEARKVRRRRQITWASVAIVILVLSGLTGYAFRQRAAALRESARSTSLYLANASESASYADLSVLLALHAMASTDTPEAEEALQRAVQALRGPRFSRRPERYVVLSIALSSDGKFLATANNDDTVAFWNAGDGTNVGDRIKVGAPVVGAVFRPNGILAVATADGSVRMLGPSGVTEEPDPLSVQELRSIALNHDGSKLAAGIQDGTIALETFPSGPEKVLKGHTLPATALAFSPKYLVSAGLDGALIVWNAATGTQVARTPTSGKDDPLTTVALNPSGAIAITGDSAGVIRAWEIPSGRLLGSQQDGDVSIAALAFSADGRTLASATVDGKLQLWDVTPAGVMTLRLGLPCDDQICNPLAFMADGQTLAVAGYFGEVRLYQTDIGKLFQAARGWVDTSQIKPEDCKKYLDKPTCDVPTTFHASR